MYTVQKMFNLLSFRLSSWLFQKISPSPIIPPVLFTAIRTRTNFLHKEQPRSGGIPNMEHEANYVGTGAKENYKEAVGLPFPTVTPYEKLGSLLENNTFNG
jgi:hypothetical protein